MTMKGSQFEIVVDSRPRSYRDIQVVAIASAEYLKSLHPHTDVAFKDLLSGTMTVVA